MSIDQKTLKSVLSYDQQTGVFIWIRRTGKRVRTHIGDVAGSFNGLGYRQIRIFGELYLAHRLAWLYMTGKWPKIIDHKNGVQGDNRWSNLREATPSINQQNKHRLQRNNTVGLAGVSRQGNGFGAFISVGGKIINLGTFCTPELAHTAYLNAKREFHPGWMI